MHPDKQVTHPVAETLKKTGYDAEGEYFYRLNTELIERNRRRLDEQRRLMETQERKKAHWMMCPKCGSHLQENDCYGVKADICDSCSGVFLDRGELEQVLAKHEPKSIAAVLKNWLKKATEIKESGLHDFPV